MCVDSRRDQGHELAGAVTVSVDSDGYLVTSQHDRWRQVEPLVFAEVDGKRRLVFRQDEHGQVVDSCKSPICVVEMQKQPWWNSRGLQFGWIGICGAVLVFALIGLPIAAVLQRRQENPAGSKLARLTAWLASVTFLGGAVMVGIGLRDPNGIVFAVPPTMRAGFTLGMVHLILSIGLVVFAVLAWRRNWWRMPGPDLAVAGVPRGTRGGSLAPSLEPAGLEVLTGFWFKSART